MTRFDLEVFPTVAEIAAGHALRVTITTSDSPHVGFTAAQLTNLVGGVYQVQHNKGSASFLQVPLAPASTFGAAGGVCR